MPATEDSVSMVTAFLNGDDLGAGWNWTHVLFHLKKSLNQNPIGQCEGPIKFQEIVVTLESNLMQSSLTSFSVGRRPPFP